MLHSERKVTMLLCLIAIICFTLGFITAKSIQQTDWIGHFVFGVWEEPNPAIYPKQSKFIPRIDGTVIIGLREDGVVVWKKVDEADK